MCACVRGAVCVHLEDEVWHVRTDFENVSNGVLHDHLAEMCTTKVTPRIRWTFSCF